MGKPKSTEVYHYPMLTELMNERGMATAEDLCTLMKKRGMKCSLQGVGDVLKGRGVRRKNNTTYSKVAEQLSTIFTTPEATLFANRTLKT